MSGVGITGQIKPKDGGAFSVFQDIDGQGGLRCVQSIADRNTFSSAPSYCSKGMQCFVADLQVVYALADDLTTWEFWAPSPALASQPEWFVDQAGSVNNDGKTIGAPIPPHELERRLFPCGGQCLLTRDVTIHLAAGLVLGFALNVGSADETQHQLTLDCALSSSAPFALTAVVQPDASTKTRGQLTTTTGTFFNQERIRLVTGASAGAIAYSTGLNAGAQNTFVSLFTFQEFNQFHAPSPPAVGDQVVTDVPLTTIRRLEVTANINARVQVKNAIIIRASVNGCAEGTPSGDNGGNVLFAGCEAISIAGFWECTAAGACLMGCRWVPTTITALKGNGWLVFGMAIQGAFCVSGGSVHSYGITIDGGGIFIGFDGSVNGPYADGSTASLTANRSYINAGSIEVENGPTAVVAGTTAAVSVANGCRFVVGDFFGTEMWGASGAYAIGYWAQSGNALFLQETQNPLNVLLANWGIPSAINVQIAGQSFAYSDNPISFPNNGSGLVLMNSAGAPFSVTDGGFYLKAQSGNHAAAVLPALYAGAGMYRVSGYVATTTADAGAIGLPTLNVLFTDDSGIARTVAVATAPSVTAAGGAGGEVIVEVAGAAATTQIEWSVTGVVTPAAALYSVRMRVEKISNGA
jgi:hypothetical protein